MEHFGLVTKWYYPVWRMISTLVVELSEHIVFAALGLFMGALIGGIVIAAAVLILGVEL